ncbi:cytochrome P450 2J5-like [Podarcis lilfordi]|uniref:Cytochrome P450 2J5-like n=1 Tax=Podarcis lilfordi TaxID=74358 RepID=A0AA35KEZ5_9SAUR|nr:cytochrome P450 2J5-like [Podarcis lilfordi]
MPGWKQTCWGSARRPTNPLPPKPVVQLTATLQLPNGLTLEVPITIDSGSNADFVGVQFIKQHRIALLPATLPLNVVTFGHRPIVVLSGFQAVKEALIDHSEELDERPETPFLTTMAKGKGIALSNGHTWRQQRRFGVVTMRKLGLGKKGMEHQVAEEAHQLVEVFARSKGM